MPTPLQRVLSFFRLHNYIGAWPSTMALRVKSKLLDLLSIVSPILKIAYFENSPGKFRITSDMGHLSSIRSLDHQNVLAEPPLNLNHFIPYPHQREKGAFELVYLAHSSNVWYGPGNHMVCCRLPHNGIKCLLPLTFVVTALQCPNHQHDAYEKHHFVSICPKYFSCFFN